MRMDGGYGAMLRAALDGAHVIDAAARRRAAAAEHAWLHAGAPDAREAHGTRGAHGAREAFRAAHAARCAAATEAAEIEGELDFPELLDDPDADFPELAN